MNQNKTFNKNFWVVHALVLALIAHPYVKSVAVWDLIVDDGLDIDRLQLELYGDVNEP